jgi:hypothetical protein
MNDRDDPPFDDGDATIESSGKEHDPFRYEDGMTPTPYAYESDDAPEDDGENDFCPDFVDVDD